MTQEASFPCRSGAHVWALASDADRCCHPDWTRGLVTLLEPGWDGAYTPTITAGWIPREPKAPASPLREAADGSLAAAPDSPTPGASR
jgi:hypothetical protein